MAQPSISDLQNLLREVVLPFYDIKRQVPLRSEPGRWENDAEHSWSLALVACALAPHIDETLDVGKVCQFAVVHDLVEVHAGDTSNFAPAEEQTGKEEREAAALQTLKTQLTSLPWITDTVMTYEAQDLPEAMFVKSVDKTLVLLFDSIEDGLFYREQKLTFEKWQNDLQTHRQKAAGHPGAFVYYEQIWDLLATHPEFFYQENGGPQ